MKFILVPLLATLALAGAVYGQTSPAATSSKSSAASAGVLTQSERDQAVDYLTKTQKDFLAAIEGVSDAQWKWKPSPERWSIAETAEHIALAEEVIWEHVTSKIMKSPAAPEKRAEVEGKEKKIMQMIPDRSVKAQAPEVVRPTGKWDSREELVNAFKATRTKEIAFLKETKEDLRNHFADHPFMKTMDAWQWLIFNGAHGKRHTLQIKEVKDDPNFPKS